MIKQLFFIISRRIADSNNERILFDNIKIIEENIGEFEFYEIVSDIANKWARIGSPQLIWYIAYIYDIIGKNNLIKVLKKYATLGNPHDHAFSDYKIVIKDLIGEKEAEEIEKIINSKKATYNKTKRLIKLSNYFKIIK